MPPSIEFLAGAKRDFAQSTAWYKAHDSATAMRFVQAVDETLAAIASDPERFAVVGRRHRRAGVRRFPFQIIFRIHQQYIAVVAIAHAKRRPGYWSNRR